MKLGTKISSLLILTALIPPIIILSYALLVIGEDRYQTVTQDVLHQVKFSGEWLSTELESAQREIELYTQRPELRDLDPTQFLPYLKQEINRQQGRFEKFIIGTPEGSFYNTAGGNPHKDMLITFDDADPNSGLQHLRHRDYWQYTVGSNTAPTTRSLISDSMISYTTGIRQIVLSSTIINNNTLVGMLGVSIGWDRILTLMDTLKSNQFSRYSWQPKLFVSGHKGIYWYHWNPDRLATLSTDSDGKVLYTEDGQPITVTHSLADEAIPSIADKINDITSGQVDFFKYQDPVSQKHFYLFYAPIRSTTYHLGLLVSEDDLIPPIIDTLLIVSTFLMSLFLVLIITYLWNRKNISEPLHQLMSYIRQIHQGHYNQKLNLQTNDELAQVASTLNEMSDAITDRENEIKELNAGLELRVKERTKALEQANLSLEALSMHDELTKLENRRAMETCITNIHKSYLSRHRIYSLLILDIDYFKPYNDHYGHIKGDETLYKVATSLAHSVRNEDRVYRYGGEEFLILLPDTDQRTALEVAQRTRLNIESIKEPHSASPFGHLTISVGLATSSKNDLKWMSLLQRADERLYSAKRIGRNQVVSE